LRAWMLLWIRYIEEKRVIAPALNQITGGMERLYQGSRGPLHAAFSDLVKEAVRSGEIRADINSEDLMQAMLGIAFTPPVPGWQQSARRLVDILMAGSRTGR
jgi:hypothetical protein